MTHFNIKQLQFLIKTHYLKLLLPSSCKFYRFYSSIGISGCTNPVGGFDLKMFYLNLEKSNLKFHNLLMIFLF